MFAANFAFQNSTFVFGIDAFTHLECRCQKQPCTKTTVFRAGITISGLPGNLLSCRLNRMPDRCRNDRTFSSGTVFFARMRPMSKLRTDRALALGLKLCLDQFVGSLTRARSPPSPSLASEMTYQRLRDVFHNGDRYGVAELPVRLHI